MRRLLIRLYPARWRRRYADELIDLLDATGVTPWIAVDVLRGALVEHGRAWRSRVREGSQMTFHFAWRHPGAWALVGALLLAPTLLFVAASALAHEVGAPGLAAAVEPALDAVNAWRPLDLLLVVAPAVAVLAAVLPLLRLELRAGEGGTEAIVAVRVRAANVVVILAGLALGGFLLAHIVSESVLQVGR